MAGSIRYIKFSGEYEIFYMIQDSLWNKSSILLDYIEFRTELNQCKIFVLSLIHEKILKPVLLENKTVLIENRVNRESKSLELTI